MKRIPLIMALIAALGQATFAPAAVRNVAWLQGTTLKNGSPVLNSIEPMAINWSAHSSIDPSVYAHQLVNASRLTVLEEGEGGGTPPAISAKLDSNGNVTVTFDGKLQTAPTVNGPWKDVSGTSPLVLPADQAKLFGRAVR